MLNSRHVEVFDGSDIRAGGECLAARARLSGACGHVSGREAPKHGTEQAIGLKMGFSIFILVRPAWRDGGGAPSAYLAGDGNFPDEFPFQEFCRELTKKLIS